MTRIIPMFWVKVFFLFAIVVGAVFSAIVIMMPPNPAIVCRDIITRYNYYCVCNFPK